MPVWGREAEVKKGIERRSGINKKKAGRKFPGSAKSYSSADSDEQRDGEG